MTPKQGTNRSVSRAASLLNAAGNHVDGATAATLADETGLPRPTALRLLGTLEEAGLLVRDQGRFALGWEMYRLGRIADPYRGIHSRVKVVLDRLVQQLQENVAYSVVTGPTSYDFTSETHGPHLLSLTRGYMGRSYPPHATAAGKILLSHLSDEELRTLLPRKLERVSSATIIDRARFLGEMQQVRDQGFAVIDNELEVGLFAVAVAVTDNNHDPIGVLVVSGRTERMKASGVEHFVRHLQPAAEQLGKSLTGTA